MTFSQAFARKGLVSLCSFVIFMPVSSFLLTTPPEPLNLSFLSCLTELNSFNICHRHHAYTSWCTVKIPKLASLETRLLCAEHTSRCCFQHPTSSVTGVPRVSAWHCSVCRWHIITKQFMQIPWGRLSVSQHRFVLLPSRRVIGIKPSTQHGERSHTKLHPWCPSVGDQAEPVTQWTCAFLCSLDVTLFLPSKHQSSSGSNMETQAEGFLPIPSQIRGHSSM